MKNKFLLLLIMIAIQMLSSISSFSQAPPPIPCVGDCPLNTWGVSRYYSFEPDPVNCPDCWIGYWMTERICNGNREFQITKVIFPSDCYSCYSLQTIWQMVLEDCITHLTICMPEKGFCFDNVSLTNAPCWTQITNPQNPHEYWLVPCYESGCCEIVYQICHWDNPDRVVWTVVQSPEMSYLCQSQGCFYVCEWLSIDGFAYFPYPKKSLGYDNSDNTVSISPNPANDKILLSLNLSIDENYRIQIYDIIGNLVYNEMNEFSNANNKVSIETRNWNNGVYYLLINSNEINLIKKVFIVNH